MPTLKFEQVKEPEQDIMLFIGSTTGANITIPKGSKIDHGPNVRHTRIRTPANTNNVSFYLNRADFLRAQDFCKTDRELLIECSTRAGVYRGGSILEMLARSEPITLTVDYDKD